MRRTRLVVALLAMVLAGANAVHAQEAATAPKTVPVAPLPDLSKLNIGNTLAQMQNTATAGDGQAPSPLQIVVQFLQLTPNQAQELAHLLQARQAAIPPLLQQIQQLTQQLESLLTSGGSPAAVGTVVIQIFGLQQQVVQIQQGFLAQFAGLLNPDQQQRLAAVQVAAQLQPILPAFVYLNLL